MAGKAICGKIARELAVCYGSKRTENPGSSLSALERAGEAKKNPVQRVLNGIEVNSELYYTEKLEPQLQVVVAFGFLITN